MSKNSFKDKFKNDYYIKISFIMLPILILIGVIGLFTLGTSYILFYVAIFLFICFFITLLIIRPKQIDKIFNDNILIKATIVKPGTFADKRYIYLEYEYKNQLHTASYRATRNSFRYLFNEGQKVDILIDKDDPKKFIFKCLYKE